MRYIISKGNQEKFEELKVFESSNIKSTYNFLCSNASEKRMPSLEAFSREVVTNFGLDPVWGFYLKDEGNELFYMKVVK